ncbi:hypothetical protein P389DRAFT_193080 [Cystobasidium minutum MCA 4210]|uniref:uncharacterized protein n=1 Tax=Cystobasidium minutum MCA 4210 TaxID=1397322 RepID=UPI0034CEED42|eukprot:jgi/Rhomi1/193080/gm1.1294_g
MARSKSSIDLRRRTNAFQQRAMAGKGKGPSGKPAARKTSASAMPRFALFALIFVVLGGIFFELARLIFL